VHVFVEKQNGWTDGSGEGGFPQQTNPLDFCMNLTFLMFIWSTTSFGLAVTECVGLQTHSMISSLLDRDHTLNFNLLLVNVCFYPYFIIHFCPISLLQCIRRVRTYIFNVAKIYRGLLLSGPLCI